MKHLLWTSIICVLFLSHTSNAQRGGSAAIIKADVIRLSGRTLHIKIKDSTLKVAIPRGSFWYDHALKIFRLRFDSANVADFIYDLPDSVIRAVTSPLEVVQEGKIRRLLINADSLMKYQTGGISEPDSVKRLARRYTVTARRGFSSSDTATSWYFNSVGLYSNSFHTDLISWVAPVPVRLDSIAIAHMNITSLVQRYRDTVASITQLETDSLAAGDGLIFYWAHNPSADKIQGVYVIIKRKNSDVTGSSIVSAWWCKLPLICAGVCAKCCGASIDGEIVVTAFLEEKVMGRKYP